MPVVAEFAQQIGLLPMLTLVLLRVQGQRRDTASWWLAGVFLVSWIADEAARWGDPWLMSLVYPMTQAGLISAVYRGRTETRVLLLLLLVVGIIAAAWHPIPDVLLRTVAWGSIVGMVWVEARGPWRWVLLWTFGVGWLAWISYTVMPGWSTWGVYQGVRFYGITGCCAVLWVSQPHLRRAL